jgi:integrase
VGEACRLRIEEVDLERQLLIIRETKFYKSRLVPFGPKLGTLLAQLLRQRRQTAPAAADDQPLFFARGSANQPWDSQSDLSRYGPELKSAGPARPRGLAGRSATRRRTVILVTAVTRVRTK